MDRGQKKFQEMVINKFEKIERIGIILIILMVVLFPVLIISFLIVENMNCKSYQQ